MILSVTLALSIWSVAIAIASPLDEAMKLIGEGKNDAVLALLQSAADRGDGAAQAGLGIVYLN